MINVKSAFEKGVPYWPHVASLSTWWQLRNCADLGTPDVCGTCMLQRWHLQQWHQPWSGTLAEVPFWKTVEHDMVHSLPACGGDGMHSTFVLLQEFHPSVNRHPKKQVLLRFYCGTQQSASCRCKQLQQTCGFRTYTELSLTLIWKSTGPPRNLHLETIQNPHCDATFSTWKLCLRPFVWSTGRSVCRRMLWRWWAALWSHVLGVRLLSVAFIGVCSLSRSFSFRCAFLAEESHMVHVSFFVLSLSNNLCAFTLTTRCIALLTLARKKMVSDGSLCQAEAVPNYDVRNVLRVWNAS